MGELTIQRLGVRGGCLLTLSGNIDESFDPAKLAEGVSGVVVIDVDGVRRITSFGVREWMNALKAMSFEACYFVRCRPAVVSQFNMVQGFGGRGELLSFYAPYVCVGCGKDLELLLDLRLQHEQVRGLTPPEVKCEACGGQAELDDVPAAYFSYVASAPKPNPPPLVEALLSGTAGGAGSNLLKVRKELWANVTALWLSGPLDKSASFKRVVDGLEGKVVVVCDGIERVTPEGVAKLSPLLEAPLELYLTRVPPELLLALAKAGRRVRVTSVRWPARCPACRKESAFELERFGAEGLSRKCPRCGCVTRLEVSREVSDAALDLGLADPPDEIQAYLVAAKGAAAKEGDKNEPTVGESFGRYQILRAIGSGGMAQVFLARQTGVGGFEKTIALKLILPNLSADPAFVSMFLQEARLAARISHPNVAQIFDVGEVASRFFIAMEFVRGADLAAILRLAAKLGLSMPVELSARIVADIAAGLHAAHTCVTEDGRKVAIIHRDVSPHNVLVASTGQVKLSDFGIAKAADTGTRTPTATIKGKLSYMAPEQVQSGTGLVDPRVDIFPAGLILYQCLTYEHPFRRDSELATFKAITSEPVPRVSSKRSDVPRELDDILDRALARDPAARYPTARAFQLDLERFIARTGREATAPRLAEWLEQLTLLGEQAGVTPTELPIGARTPSHLAADQTPTKVTATATSTPTAGHRRGS